MPPPHLLNGGTSEPISEYWIDATRQTLSYWSEFSTMPHAFGSHLPGHPMHNFTQFKFELSLGHYLAGTPRISVQRLPQAILKAGWGFMAVDTRRPHFDLDAFVASIHGQDFLRHTRSTVVMGATQPTNAHAFATPSGPLRQKVAIVAVVSPSSANRDHAGAPRNDRVLRGTVKGAGTAPLTFSLDIPHCDNAIVAFRYFPDTYLPAGTREIELDISPDMIQASLVSLQE